MIRKTERSSGRERERQGQKQTKTETGTARKKTKTQHYIFALGHSTAPKKGR